MANRRRRDPEPLADILVQKLKSLTLGGSGRQSSDGRGAPDAHFVGGFNVNGKARQQQRSSGASRSTQTSSRPPGFPVPGPLPAPPVIIPMPMPQHDESRPALSLTMHHALSAPPDHSFHAHHPSLRPPTGTSHRPHSDPPLPPFADHTPLSNHPLRTPPRPVKASRTKVPATVQPSRTTLDPPETPHRTRAASAPSTPLSATSSKRSGNTVQCSGTTKLGARCKKPVSTNTSSGSMSPEADLDMPRFCHQHAQKVQAPSGFYAQNKGEFICFAEWISDYLRMATQLALRTELAKPISTADQAGYIYAFEIRDPGTPDMIHFKVGRSVQIINRLDQWQNQCGSKEQILRGFWPATADADRGQLLRGMVRPGEKGKWCHRVERLVHLELADLAAHAPYLHPDFPSPKSEDISARSSRGTPGANEGRKPCTDCGTLHKEIFSFPRAERDSRYWGKEWELVVKPVIEKWGGFVDGFF